MKTDKHSLLITACEYNVLTNNYLISTVCAGQLGSVHEQGDEVELTMTYSELKDLIGFVAAEANHAKTKRQSDDLNQICDYLESVAYQIRLNQEKRS
jgi:hypothetical protein